MRLRLGKGGGESPFSNSFYCIEKLTDYLEQSTIIKNYIPMTMTMLSQEKGALLLLDGWVKGLPLSLIWKISIRRLKYWKILKLNLPEVISLVQPSPFKNLWTSLLLTLPKYSFFLSVNVLQMPRINILFRHLNCK